MNTKTTLKVTIDAAEVKRLIERDGVLKSDVELQDIIDIIEKDLQGYMDDSLSNFIEDADLSAFIEE